MESYYWIDVANIFHACLDIHCGNLILYILFSYCFVKYLTSYGGTFRAHNILNFPLISRALDSIARALEIISRELEILSHALDIISGKLKILYVLNVPPQHRYV